MSAMNKNNSAVKRIMQEARELANDPCTDYFAAPLEDDIFEWHCTLRGPHGTEFEGGLYHFRILLPAEYPFRPPSIMMLTPNGRFELNTKICISFTDYHEELWQPAWGVRTAILGLQGFFPLKGQAAIGVGSIEYPTSERKRLATLSREWVCPHCCEKNITILPDTAEKKCTNDTMATDAADNGPTPTFSSPQPSTPTSDELCSVYVTRSAGGVVLPSENLTNPLPSPLTSDVSNPSSPPHSTAESSPRTGSRDRQTSPLSLRGPHRPPLLLDTAICVLLVLVVALICRRFA